MVKYPDLERYEYRPQDSVLSHNQSRYSRAPSELVTEVLSKLSSIGQAIIVVRSTNGNASVNIVGTVFLGIDAQDHVIRVKENSSHIHVDWGTIAGHEIRIESSPGGIEPVVCLVDSQREPVVRLFYPGCSSVDLDSLLR